MAQQLQSFTQRMMEGVIADHSTRTEHDRHCCALADEYASRLGAQAPQAATAPAAKVPAPREEPFETVFASDRQLDYILSLGRRVGQELISQEHRDQLKTVRNGEIITREEARGLIEVLKAQTDQRPQRPSDRQIGFLHSLLKKHVWEGEIDFEGLTMSGASEIIAELKKAPLRVKTETEKPAKAAPRTDRYIPEAGYYFLDGVYYQVREPKVEGGAFYGYRWSPEAEAWRYDGQKRFRLLTADKKLTAEQATVFGKTYGKCIVKGCGLTHPRSIELGYGPTCAKNQGWPY